MVTSCLDPASSHRFLPDGPHRTLTLQELHDATTTLGRFGALLYGRRILWVDPNPHGAEGIISMTKTAAQAGRTKPPAIEKVDTPDEALDRMATSSWPFDLVVTHWGQPATGAAPGRQLLEGMRRRDLRVPVIVYDIDPFVDETKPQALMLGAQAYCWGFDRLCEEIVRIFTPGRESGG
jgi:hypothetical protein